MDRYVTVIYRTLALCIAISLFSHCAEETNQTMPDHADSTGVAFGKDGNEGTTGCKSVDAEVTVELAGIAIDFKPNEGAYRGDLLILPGWNESRDALCTRSRLCIRARNKGFRVILPEMGKSVYTQVAYPETRADWKKYPTAKFLTDTLIPALQQEYCLFEEDANNFVIGVSAGARGAIRLIQDLPDLFVGAAALSGDYDPSQMIGDNIYRGFIGRHEEFPDRWTVNENLLSSVQGMKTPLYLGHGKKDPLVPYTQTENFFNTLKRKMPDLKVQLNLPNERSSGFAYWTSEVNGIFRFFEDIPGGLPESP